MSQLRRSFSAKLTLSSRSATNFRFLAAISLLFHSGSHRLADGGMTGSNEVKSETMATPYVPSPRKRRKRRIAQAIRKIAAHVAKPTMMFIGRPILTKSAKR